MWVVRLSPEPPKIGWRPPRICARLTFVVMIFSDSSSSAVRVDDEDDEDDGRVDGGVNPRDA